MTSPALEKARSDVALDACIHNRRLAKLAISGYLRWYLPHHYNMLVSLKIFGSPDCFHRPLKPLSYQRFTLVLQRSTTA